MPDRGWYSPDADPVADIWETLERSRSAWPLGKAVQGAGAGEPLTIAIGDMPVTWKVRLRALARLWRWRLLRF